MTSSTDTGWWPYPSMSGPAGWYEVSSGPLLSDSEAPPASWVSNYSFDSRDDIAFGLPMDSIATLPVDGVIVTVLLQTPDIIDTSVGLQTSAMVLDDADVRPEWEGSPNQGVPEYHLQGSVGGTKATIRCFFGTQDPGADMLTAAQQVIDSLDIEVLGA
jgi:hypothetical protein